MNPTDTAPDIAAATDGASPAATPEPGDSYVHSFAKGLEIIRSFGPDAASQTLTEVAQRAGVTRSGARRILLTLQHLGYVRSDGRQYRLTAKILSIGFSYLSSLPFWNLAEPVVDALASTVNEACSLAVLEGAEVVCVHRVSPQKIMTINLAVGSRLPALVTALGRVLLSGLPPHELQALLARQPEPRPLTTRTVTNLETVRELIDQARQQGWCLVNQELEEGLVSLAAPIVDRSGQMIAALEISSQYARTPPKHMREHFLPQLQLAAKSISRMLQMRQ